MISRALDRIHAFGQRPGVTPGRVAPWVALLILGLAFVIGMNLEPVGQNRASYDDGSIVVAGGGQPQAQLPAGTGSGAGAVAGASAESSDDEPVDEESGSEDAGDAGGGDAPLDDGGGSFTDPLPEPAYTEPAAPDPGSGGGSGGQSGGGGSDSDEEDQPTAEETESYEGTVVRVNQAAQSYAIATSEQDLIAIHADKLPKHGAAIRVDVRPLSNGTYVEAADREKLDEATGASFRGWITWVAPDGLRYTLSNRGVSLVVARERSPDALPLGAPVVVGADLDPKTGTLQQTSLTSEGERTDAPVNLTGIVRRVDPEARTVVLTADDLGESEAELTLAVTDPAIDLTRVTVDLVVNASAVIGADGTYTLTGLWANSDAAAADDPTTAQGDQVVQEDPKEMAKRVDKLLRSLGIL